MVKFDWIVGLAFLEADSERHARSFVIQPLSPKYLKFKIEINGAKKINFGAMRSLDKLDNT